MYRDDREWSDKYIDQVKSIIGELPISHFMDIKNAPVERDMKHATDLVLKIPGPMGGDIAVRLRRPFDKKGRKLTKRDLTLRAHRDTGAITEEAKIKGGFGDFYFYGWIDENGILSEWMFVDLNKLRASGLLEIKRPQRPNGDGTYFVVITVKELRMAGCLIAMQSNKKGLQRNVRTSVLPIDILNGIEQAKNRNYHHPYSQGYNG